MNIMASTEKSPSPTELWIEVRGDGVRYRELLIKHGYLIPDPPKASPHCCCPEKKEGEDVNH